MVISTCKIVSSSKLATVSQLLAALVRSWA